MSKSLKLAAAVALATFALQAQAHGPTRQKVEEEVTINAPAAKVWAIVGDFNGTPKWVPAVKASSVTNGNNVNSVRTQTMQNGEKLQEYVEEWDPKKMELRYREHGVNVKALPVDNYSSWLTVTATGPNQCKVEWKGAFYRGYLNNDPPKDLNDEAAIKAITDLYHNGLANLKKIAESGK